MTAQFSLTAAPGGALTTTCKTCGQAHTAARNLEAILAWLHAWRAGHQCTPAREATL